MVKDFPYTLSQASVCRTISIGKGIEVDGKEVEIDRSNSTKFTFNLRRSITLPISEYSYLNAEVRFMFAKETI